MARLRNSQADIEIGITAFGAFKQPALYVQEGNQRRLFATFLSKEKADMFMELLERWDENGGSDEKYT
jgi:hypothetical protein